MKRIRPVSRYEGSDYPASAQGGVDRRSFLRTLAAGAATAGGVALLGAEGATRPLGGAPAMHYQAHITLPKGYKYAKCRKVIRSLAVSTWDSRLAFFLNNKGERARVLKTVYAVLAKHKCPDLTDRSRRRRLASKIARALLVLYTKRTKRKSGVPTVWILFRQTQKTCGNPVGPTLDDTPPPM